MIRVAGFLLLSIALAGCESGQTARPSTSNPTAPDASAAASGNRAMPAPDFTLKDLQGNSVQLSSLRGKGVVIAFWFLG